MYHEQKIGRYMKQTPFLFLLLIYSKKFRKCTTKLNLFKNNSVNHGQNIDINMSQAPSFSSYLSIRKKVKKIRISENFPTFLLINSSKSNRYQTLRCFLSVLLAVRDTGKCKPSNKVTSVAVISSMACKLTNVLRLAQTK